MRPDPEKPGVSMPYLKDRDTLGHWAGKQVSKGEMGAYRQEWNYDSLDGLTGLRAARKVRGESLWIGDARTWMRRHSHGAQMVLVAILSTLITLGLVYGLDFGVAVMKLLN
jgi:hypothetical protein